MSQATTYEQLIARKLEELVVPDHASAIWVTIEQQLDIEMPADGNKGGDGFNHHDWWIGGGFFTIAIAIIMYVAISKQHLRNNRPEREKPEVIPQQVPSETLTDSMTYPGSPASTKVSSRPAGSVVVPAVKETPKPVARKTEDTIAPMAVPVSETAVQTITTDSIPTPKKSKGMKGITDADYKIVPSKKDEGG